MITNSSIVDEIRRNDDDHAYYDAYGYGMGDDVNVLTRAVLHWRAEDDGTPSSVIHILLPNDLSRCLYGLLDSGSSLSLALESATPPPDTEWREEQTATLVRTKAGKFETSAVAELTIVLPEFSVHREVTFAFHRDDTKMSPGAPVYEFILGA